TLTNNWKPQETPYMHALVVKLLWDRLQDTALHSCHKQLHHTLVRLAVTFHTSLVREMFVTEQQVNSVDSEGMAVLHRVAMFDSEDHVRVVLFLISKGANVNLQTTTGDTPLHVAAKHKNWAIMEVLLHRQAKSDVVDCEQRSVLHIMASYADPECFSDINDILPLLIHNNSDINKKDREGNTALHLAALAGNMGFVKTLLHHGARADVVNDEQKTYDLDCTSRSLTGETVLQIAAKHGDWSMVKRLVEYVGNIDQVDSEGLTLVQRLMTKKAKLHTSIFYRLLELGVNLTCRDANGDTVLHLAARNERWDIVNYLVEPDRDGLSAFHRAATSDTRGARKYVVNIDETDSEGLTLIQRLAMSKEGNFGTSLLRRLLELGADYTCRDANGDTVLHLAARNDHWKIVKYFVNPDSESSSDLHKAETVDTRGARKYVVNIDETDSEGLTLIQRLVNSKKGKLHFSLLRRLIELGADYTCRDANGDTVLHLAARNDHWKIVKYLVQLGVGTDSPDSDGFSVLHRAATAMEETAGGVLLYILKRNPDLHKRTRQGDTAVHLAARHRQWDAVKLLTKYGANILDNDSESTTVLQRMIACPDSTGQQICILRSLVKTCSVEQLSKSYGLLLFQACRLNVVRFLLDHGVSIHQRDSEGLSLLHHVAKTRECLSIKMTQHLQYFLEKGIGLEDRCPNGNTPLHFAAKFDNWDMVIYLVERGACIQDPDSDGVYVLQRLAMYSEYGEKHSELLRLLITNGADVTIRDCNDNSTLHLSAKGNNWSFVRQIIQETGDLNIDELDSDGYNILHRLAQSEHSELVEDVLNRGCNVEALSRDGDTCLLLAAKRDNWTFVKSVLGHVFNRKHSDNKAMKEHLHTLDVIISSGVDVNATDPRGNTAIHIAAKRQLVGIVKRLIDIVDNLNTTDSDGFTVLLRLAQTPHPQCLPVLRRLVQKGADINFCSIQAEKANWDAVIVFVEHGADINILDRYGRSLLHTVVGHLSSRDNRQLNKQQLLTFLVEHGADINRRSQDNKTVLQVAAARNDWETVGVLIQLGADWELTPSKKKSAFRKLHLLSWENVDEEKMCIEKSNWPMAKALVECGADVFQLYTHRTLLEGANPLLVNSRRWTLLREVAELDNYSMMTALMKLLPAGVTTHQPRFTEAMLQSQKVSTAQTASPTEKMIRDKNIFALKLLIESGASSNAELFRLNTEYQVKLAGQADTDAKNLYLHVLEPPREVSCWSAMFSPFLGKGRFSEAPLTGAWLHLIERSDGSVAAVVDLVAWTEL
ncbi:hypothetical protein C0Q70_04751, partial [Pomacea canaliculata]